MSPCTWLSCPPSCSVRSPICAAGNTVETQHGCPWRCRPRVTQRCSPAVAWRSSAKVWHWSVQGTAPMCVLTSLQRTCAAWATDNGVARKAARCWKELTFPGEGWCFSCVTNCITATSPAKIFSSLHSLLLFTLSALIYVALFFYYSLFCCLIFSSFSSLLSSIFSCLFPSHYIVVLLLASLLVWCSPICFLMILSVVDMLDAQRISSWRWMIESGWVFQGKSPHRPDRKAQTMVGHTKTN